MEGVLMTSSYNDFMDDVVNFNEYSSRKNKKAKSSQVQQPEEEQDSNEFLDDVVDLQNYNREIQEKKKVIEQQPTDYTKIGKDVAKQAGKELLIGVGGTYGDLFSLIGKATGLENKGEAEGYEAKTDIESDILGKLQKPGYIPSIGELQTLSDEDILPTATRLPTSEDLRNANELIGGPGEAETLPGKVAGRSGRIYGAGLATGQINPIPALIAGTAGQATEELGGGPLLQAGAEIVSLLLTQGRGQPLSSINTEVRQNIENLRRLGYTDEQITLAINSAYRNSKVAKIASKGRKTEEAFEDFTTRSDQMVSDILTSEIPGIERGTQHVHQLASDAYGHVANNASNIQIKNADPFFDSLHSVYKRLTNTLGDNPEARPFLEKLYSALGDAVNNPTAERFIEFYKELNGMGKWLGRNQRDTLLTQVKNGIKDTFRREGPEGRRLANDFEQVNEGIRRAYLAEDVHDLLQKVTTVDGINYTQMRKLFDKPDNVHLFEEVLGATQARNLELIANTGKNVKDFDKAWKAANAYRIGTPADIARAAAIPHAILTGDMAGLALALGTKAGSIVVRKIAEKSLTDPKFQNLIIKGLHAVQKSSPTLMRHANDALQKYLDDEGIDINLK